MLKQPVFGAVPGVCQIIDVALSITSPDEQLAMLADPTAAAIALPENPKHAIPATRKI